MNETNTIEKLQTIINDMISRYSTLNEAVSRLQTIVEEKDKEIAKLSEDNEMKDLEIEEIISKIEKIIK
jgi:uncharacterized protein YwgA